EPRMARSISTAYTLYRLQAGWHHATSHQHAPGPVAFAVHEEQGAAVWAVGEGVDDFTGRSCRGKDAFSARRAGEFHQPCALGLELLDVIEVPLHGGR